MFCRRAFDWDETGKVAPEFWVKPELEPFFRNYVKTRMFPFYFFFFDNPI